MEVKDRCPSRGCPTTLIIDSPWGLEELGRKLAILWLTRSHSGHDMTRGEESGTCSWRSSHAVRPHFRLTFHTSQYTNTHVAPLSTIERLELWRKQKHWVAIWKTYNRDQDHTGIGPLRLERRSVQQKSMFKTCYICYHLFSRSCICKKGRRVYEWVLE